MPYFLWCDILKYLDATDIGKLSVHNKLACVLKECDWKKSFLEKRTERIAIVSYSPNAANTLSERVSTAGAMDTDRLYNFWKYAFCNYIKVNNVNRMLELIDLDSKTKPSLIYKVFIKKGNFKLDQHAGTANPVECNYNLTNAHRVEITGSKFDTTIIDTKYSCCKNIICIIPSQYFIIKHITFKIMGFLFRSIRNDNTSYLYVTNCIFDAKKKTIFNIESTEIPNSAVSINVIISDCTFNKTFRTSIEPYRKRGTTVEPSLPICNYTISRSKFVGNTDSIFFSECICHKSSSVLITNNEITNAHTTLIHGNGSTPIIFSDNYITNVRAVICQDILYYVYNPSIIFSHNTFTNVDSLYYNDNINVILHADNIFVNCGSE